MGFGDLLGDKAKDLLKDQAGKIFGGNSGDYPSLSYMENNVSQSVSRVADNLNHSMVQNAVLDYIGEDKSWLNKKFGNDISDAEGVKIMAHLAHTMIKKGDLNPSASSKEAKQNAKAALKSELGGDFKSIGNGSKKQALINFVAATPDDQKAAMTKVIPIPGLSNVDHQQDADTQITYNKDTGEFNDPSGKYSFGTGEKQETQAYLEVAVSETLDAG